MIVDGVFIVTQRSKYHLDLKVDQRSHHTVAPSIYG